jgi:hypothetical protein
MGNPVNRSKSQPREQHIVPRVYLKRFTDPDDPPHLWVYEKGKAEPRRRSINQILRIRDYYTMRGDDGGRDYTIESGIFQVIEQQIEPVLAKLDAGGWPLTEEERSVLAEFLTFQRMRVPSFLRYMEQRSAEEAIKWAKSFAADAERFEATMSDLIARGEFSPLEGSIEELRQEFLAQDEREWKADHLATMVNSLRRADLIHDQIVALRWRFFEAPEGSEYITGDNPVVIADPKRRAVSFTGFNPADEDTMLMFPVTPRMALLGDRVDGPDRMGRGDAAAVRFVNQWTILGAARHICARRRTEGLDELVRKFGAAESVRMRDLPRGASGPLT